MIKKDFSGSDYFDRLITEKIFIKRPSITPDLTSPSVGP